MNEHSVMIRVACHLPSNNLYPNTSCPFEQDVWQDIGFGYDGNFNREHGNHFND